MRRTFAALGVTALRFGGRAMGVSRLTMASRTATPMATSALVAFQQVRLPHDSALCDATRRELEEEMSRSGKPEEPTPPPHWRVMRTPGKCTFDMVRSYEDEEIAVSYLPKEDAGDVNTHEIVVLITRNGHTLQADLSIEEGELVLDNICFYNESALAKDKSAEADAKRMELYPGPKVSELDEALIDSFIKYLEKRGVNEELGEFITLYSFWAEQQEYEGWLGAINKFVA